MSSASLRGQPALIERVRRDLVRGLKEPRKGRRGLTAPHVLCALVLMRLKNWAPRDRERAARRKPRRIASCGPRPNSLTATRGCSCELRSFA
jgi:hypothetical protein